MDKAQMIECIMELRNTLGIIDRTMSTMQSALDRIQVERNYAQDRIDELNEKILAQESTPITEASDH